MFFCSEIALDAAPASSATKKLQKDRVLRPIRPNVGLEVEYRRRVLTLVDEMRNSVLYWLRASYRANEPEISDAVTIAEDALPASELSRAVRKLTRRWQSRFDEAADDLADWFSQSVSKRSDAVLKSHLKKAGISVQFRMTRAHRDVMRATIKQNVALIRSVPKKALSDVEGAVMRSVQTGRDLHSLTKTLEKQFGVTRRRAALIARDQNSKATSALTRVRRVEIGLTKAIWLHSHAGKVPRPTHVKMDGKRFDVRKGMWDSAVSRWIQPGEEIECRCVSRVVVSGFS